MKVFTVIIRPSPRGLSREELLNCYLEPCGKVVALRFGTGNMNDYAYVDYGSPDAAKKAVKSLNGEKFNGSVRCSATLTPATIALIEKAKDDVGKPTLKRPRKEASLTSIDAGSFGAYRVVDDIVVYSISYPDLCTTKVRRLAN